jgi:hypothetical protein
MYRGTCFVESCAKDIRKVGQEEGYQGGWYVESWCKDNANISHRHLVQPGIVYNLNQE